MLTLRKAEECGHAHHGWRETYHTLSFAGHQDPRYLDFRRLRVINDDAELGGADFDTLPHRDLEFLD